MQKTLPFAQAPITAAQSVSPEGYTGLYGFHKYWGKKPHEPIAYVIEQLTNPDDLVLDPFVGSGSSARESVTRHRRFVGFDVNPVAVELARLISSPPSRAKVLDAYRAIEAAVKSRILKTYALSDGTTATHYLWEGDSLHQVWVKGNAAVSRRELPPLSHDIALFASFDHYQSQRIRGPQFFSNGRINASRSMTLSSLLTGRAQHNLDLLLEAIGQCDESAKAALRLCLTASSGQMTRMVFAVTGRGKTTGKSAEKVEVGSWVIGYWRPHLHFEVNVWNCFENRARKLLKALTNAGEHSVELSAQASDICNGRGRCHIGLTD